MKAVEPGDKAAAQAVYQESVKVTDRIADKGVFHKNKAARHKSRLSAKVKALDLISAKPPRRLIRDKRKTLKPDGFGVFCIVGANPKWRKGCGFYPNPP